MNRNPIILASQSPRRKQLLEWAEVPFEIRISQTDESFPAGLPPEDVAEHIAKEKALAVRQHMDSDPRPIVAADTIVVVDGEILGKPKDRGDAIRMLTLLSGKTHRVITGVCILHHSKVQCWNDITDVRFHALTFEQITFYVDRYAPYDKAGAYAIQEWIGVVGIASISGDFYNVMGLPVSRLVRALDQLSP